MLPAVDFNDDFASEADEIYDVVADRNLSLELRTTKTMSATKVPQPKLGIGHAPSQRFRVSKAHTISRPRGLSVRSATPQKRGGEGERASRLSIHFRQFPRCSLCPLPSWERATRRGDQKSGGERGPL